MTSARTARSRWDGETALVPQLAACASLISFLYLLSATEILLLYGDAVAHINIARRVIRFPHSRDCCN